MRGSAKDECFICQTYRDKIAEILELHDKDILVFDPLEGCDVEASNEVDFETGKKVFFDEIDEVCDCSLLVVYLPEASMGSAIEMWMADERRIPIISITTMKENWTIKFLSDRYQCPEQNSHRWFEISIIKTLYQYKGNKQCQHKVSDCCRIVFEAMV